MNDAVFPPAHDPESAPPPPPPADGTPAETLPPWEDRGHFGWFAGFFETIRRVMMEPAKLFGRMQVTKGIGLPLLFFVILYVLMTVVERIWSQAFSGLETGLMTWLGEFDSEAAGELAFAEFLETMGLFMSPVFALIAIFINAGIAHLSVLLLVPGQRGFEATFRAVAYGASPYVLGVVPMCGGVIALPWILFATIVGLRHLHRTSPTRALAAVLVPAFLLACGCFGMAMSLGLFAAALDG